jgi:VWFA-related protein
MRNLPSPPLPLRLAGLGVLAGLLASAPAPAQPPPSSAFGERIEVTVVNVEVVVRDRQGRPVRDLGREDFELLEDGKPVPISNFAAVGSGARQGAAAPEPSPAAAEEQAAPATPAAAPAAAPKPLRLVIYVDDVNLLPNHRKRVFRQLGSFLRDQLPAAAEVMVVVHGLGTRILVPFTRDRDAVWSALEAEERSSPVGVGTYRARISTLGQIRAFYDDRGCAAVREMEVQAETFARIRHQEVLGSLAALEQVSDSLAGLEGRKALLHVSDGMPLVAGQEMYDFVRDLCPDSITPFTEDEFRASSALRRLTTSANADGVTVYTLEALGLPSFTASSAELPTQTLSPRLDAASEANYQDTLFNLADETGGRAIFHHNQVADVLAEVAEELATYYSLGFAPEHHGDGKEHRLEVRVDRPGVELRYRKSYRDRTDEELAVAALATALLHGGGDNPLGARLAMEPAGAAANGIREVPFRLEVPMANLVLLPAGDHREIHLRLRAMAGDDRGGTSPVRSVDIPLAVPEDRVEEALARSFSYEIRLTLRSGPHRLALAVEDLTAATTSYLTLDFTVPGG